MVTLDEDWGFDEFANGIFSFSPTKKNEMVQRTAARKIRVFFLIWFGQLFSLIGSSLTGFALGLWVYQRSGSATQFALISVFTTLPGILISPLAGAIVDRWNRRWIMILSECGAGLCTLAIAMLFLANLLDIWHIYLGMSLISTFSAFRLPAFSATITLLVPREHLGRASGMAQIGEASAEVLAPALAGILVGTIGIASVFLIDFPTYLFAVATLLIVKFPKPKTTSEGHLEKRSLLREVAYGWTYITARPGLMGLLMLFAASNFLTGIASVLIAPMILSFSSSVDLGAVLSSGSIGILISSLVMSVWGGPKRRVYGLFIFGILEGVCIILAGLRPSTPLIAVATFGNFFSLPISTACNQAIWQSKVAPDVQGRVFAVRRMIALSSLPVAYLLAGPLADNVFEPLLVISGPLAGSLGWIIGVGPGRGIGLLFIVLGTLDVLTTAGFYLYPRFRMVEDELPNVIAH